MKAFTIEEMENIFEIGRAMQYAFDEGEIELEDSKGAFSFALELAIEFEKEHPNSDDYYSEIDDFINHKLLSFREM
jgi:hypothetical protein